MFTRAQLKLTFFYSCLFLAIFAIFSFAIYWWMAKSLDDSYIQQVRELNRIRDVGFGPFTETHRTVVTIAGEVAIQSLYNALYWLNIVLLIFIPIISWLLAYRTLMPIRIAHERQNQFVSDASHELRTPLSIMTGELELALNRNRSPAYYKQTLNSSKEELTRLNQLVENLLFLARSDQNRIKFSMSDVDMVDSISTTIARLYPKYSEKNQTIQFEPPENPPEIHGDASLITQLLYNLIDNAITYTQAGGTIQVKLNRGHRNAYIHIQDNGPGIPKEHLTKIFNRFYRADSSRTGHQGHGLGLAIAQTIVDLHSGTVSVKSDSGKGTTFTIRLPLTARTYPWNR